MLEYEVVKQPDAIEKYFCKPFDELKRHEMDVESFMMLSRLLLIPKNATFSHDDKPFLIKVIEKRIPACFTFKTNDERLILFLAYIAESPGSAVMYLTYIQYWCKQKNIKEMDLDIFCKIFPEGFPSKEDLHILWEKTKIARDGSMGTGNLVDYQSAIKSIQFLPEEKSQANS